jgi:uncharacterized RDD family membrane protein YckC
MLYDAAAVIALSMLVTALAMLAGFRELSVVRDPLYSGSLAATWFLYLGWCWRRGGMTLGMRAWRVRIETLQGEPRLARVPDPLSGVAAVRRSGRRRFPVVAVRP